MNLKKENEKKSSAKTFLFVLIIAATGFLLSPFFSVKTIQITQLERYTQSEICEKINLSEGINSIFFAKKKAERTLKKDPYISDVKISLNLPSTIIVDIKERKVRGYVPYMGSYLYIDEYGRVLDVQTHYEKKLPLVEGLDFKHFQKGELLPVKNQESFDVVVKIAQVMTKYKKYNLLDLIVRIDVSDPKDICAYVNKVEVQLGDISDCDQKIRTMAEIINTIPESDRGTLNLKDMSKTPIFQYLT